MTDLKTALSSSIEYCRANDIPIPADLYLDAYMVGAVKASGQELPAISAQYHDEITASLTTYFEGGSVTAPRNQFKQAMVQAFGDAFDLGWSDGGAEPPPDGEALEWFNAKVQAEFGFIDSTFVQAKELRNDENADTFTWTTERADGYVRTLAAVYNAGRMYAKKNRMLTWHLGNTEKHCETCSDLNGQRHRASWYLARNYIPRQPGAAMKCGGYYCDCGLTDDKGNEVTI